MLYASDYSTGIAKVIGQVRLSNLRVKNDIPTYVSRVIFGSLDLT